jgi:glutathione S-transferase
MADHDFTLYIDNRFLSPYAMSAFVALTEKGVPFQLKKVDLAKREHLQEDYARLSMTRRIPTLTDGAFHLSESSAIAEYLEDLLPAPDNFRLYPADARERATARQIQAWLRSDFMPIREERNTEVIFLGPVKKPLSHEAVNAAASLFDAAAVWLRPGAHNLFGDDWCLADTDLALMLNRLVLNGDPVPARLADYARHQWQRPSVQTWVTQAHQMAALAASRAKA